MDNKNCQLCKNYKDGYCEELELKPSCPEVGCDYFEPKNNTIWLVSYWDGGSEPVTTAFNNEEAANKCYKYFKKCHEMCCLDRCPIYSTFLESEEK